MTDAEKLAAVKALAAEIEEWSRDYAEQAESFDSEERAYMAGRGQAYGYAARKFLELLDN